MTLLRSLVVVVLCSLALAGCVNAPSDETAGTPLNDHHGDLSKWMSQAQSIEQQGRQLGSINKPAAHELCRTLMYAMTPELWLYLSSDVGGKYSTTVEQWVVLDSWRRMRCHGGALAQPQD